MLHQKWTDDHSVLTSVVHYITFIQHRLSQIKILANDSEQKSKVKERTFRVRELVLTWTPSLISKIEN